MAVLDKLKKKRKHQSRVDRPEVITNKFELNFEDVIQNNRLGIVVFISAGLIAVAMLIPSAVYKSTADNKRVIVQAEDGKVTNPSKVTIIKSDNMSEDGYIEFGQ